MQERGDLAALPEAQQQIDKAKRMKDKLGSMHCAKLTSKLADVEALKMEVEVLAKAREDGFAMMHKSKEALVSGNREEAMILCSQARSFMEDGLKSDMLREAVEDLEAKIESAVRAEENRCAGGECMAATQAALLQGDIDAAWAQLEKAREHFVLAGTTEMRAVLEALAAHIEAAEARDEQDTAQWYALLDEASGLIKQGELVRARTVVDKARILCAAASAGGLEEGLELIEHRLKEEERREAVRRGGDEAMQEAVDNVGLGNLSAARSAIGKARTAYERAGAEGMLAAVERIEAEIDAAESDVAAEAAAAATAAAAAEEKPVSSPWRKAKDPRSGLEYYYHSESSWLRPDGYDSDGDPWPRAGTIRPRPPAPPPSDKGGAYGYRRGNSSDLRSEVGEDSKPPTPDPALRPGLSAGGEGASVLSGPRTGGETVEAYAAHLGIDIRAERGLVWIAEEGLRAPLPPGYIELADADGTR